MKNNSNVGGKLYSNFQEKLLKKLNNGFEDSSLPELDLAENLK
jgi:hypothetical protein